MSSNIKGKPDWLRVQVRQGENYTFVEDILKKRSLNSVCSEAHCPNRGECYSNKTATFIVMGKVCTRNCTFCTVTKGETLPLDRDEPNNLALAVKELALKYVVITSVTRDDLLDGGAAHFAQIIRKTKEINPNVIIEVLIPDFNGSRDSLQEIIDASPHIINHNMETVAPLYDSVRPQAVYQRSLELLKRVKEIAPEIITKSGIMLGLGENGDQVYQLLKDLREVDCQLLTVGQYLAPSEDHHDVIEYVHPDVFDEYKRLGNLLGFSSVASSPLVRSSYNAEKMYNLVVKGGNS